MHMQSAAYVDELVNSRLPSSLPVCWHSTRGPCTVTSTDSARWVSHSLSTFIARNWNVNQLMMSAWCRLMSASLKNRHRIRRLVHERARVCVSLWHTHTHTHRSEGRSETLVEGSLNNFAFTIIRHTQNEWDYGNITRAVGMYRGRNSEISNFSNLSITRLLMKLI